MALRLLSSLDLRSAYAWTTKFALLTMTCVELHLIESIVYGCITRKHLNINPISCDVFQLEFIPPIVAVVP